MHFDKSVVTFLHLLSYRLCWASFCNILFNVSSVDFSVSLITFFPFMLSYYSLVCTVIISLSFTLCGMDKFSHCLATDDISDLHPKELKQSTYVVECRVTDCLAGSKRNSI
jgi:hypothetical protein